MTDHDFLKLLNAVVKLAKPFHKEAPDLDRLDINFKETTIDSLDMLMIGLYLGDVFGISEEDAKQMMVATPGELFEIIKKTATKFPEDVDKAIEGLQ
jgi:acyl carrier protein